MSTDRKMDALMKAIGDLESRTKKILVIVQSLAVHLQDIEDVSPAAPDSDAIDNGKGYMITAKVLPVEGIEVRTPTGRRRYQQGHWLSAEDGQIVDEPKHWSY